MQKAYASTRLAPPQFLLLILAVSAGLVAVLGLTYGYDTLSRALSAAGILALLGLASVVWAYWVRAPSSLPGYAITTGVALGLLWAAEISMNNFVAPPLPARDIIDDIFWAAIALGIFLLAIVSAFRSNRIRKGIAAGGWSGLASGAVACLTALTVAAVAMNWVLQDPLNIAEWAERGAASSAPTMAAYLAFEMQAGAMLHLIGLGLIMGLVLGAIGGVIGKAARRVAS